MSDNSLLHPIEAFDDAEVLATCLDPYGDEVDVFYTKCEAFGNICGAWARREP